MTRKSGNWLQRLHTLDEMPDLRGRVVLLTGASGGIGRAMAHRLAATGATTLLAVRDPERGKQLRDDITSRVADASVHVVEMDLADSASVRTAAATVLERWDRLDLLIGNAGYFGLEGREETADGWERHFGVNYLAHALLIWLLRERLEASAPSRIVLVGSDSYKLARGGLDFDDLMMDKGEFDTGRAYARSKLATMLYVRELSRQLSGTGVDINAAHPGWVETPMMMGQLDRPVLRLAVPLVRRALFSPDQAAAGLLWVALAPSLIGQSGLYFERGIPTEPTDVGRDDDAARHLWTATEGLVAGPASASGSEKSEAT